MTKMATIPENYNNIRAGIVELLKTARSAAARNVNALMTATYWEIGRRIVESEQSGEKTAKKVFSPSRRLVYRPVRTTAGVFEVIER